VALPRWQVFGANLALGVGRLSDSLRTKWQKCHKNVAYHPRGGIHRAQSTIFQEGYRELYLGVWTQLGSSMLSLNQKILLGLYGMYGMYATFGDTDPPTDFGSTISR
jgi:hypothetical protein